MGDPKKPRKKYHRPVILWQKDMIDEQKNLTKEYGLKNKKEIWRIESLLKKFREQAKKLIANTSEQGKKESSALIAKLVKLNLIPPSSKLEDILILDLKNILERRLQTLVYKKNLAKSIKQARQFVVHGHISINNNKINIPSYLVPLKEENQIDFSENSSLYSKEHPERIKEKSKKKTGEIKKEEFEEVIAKEKTKKKIEEKDIIKKEEELSKEEPEEKIIKEEKEVIKENDEAIKK